jgi:hypothetical protein
MGIVGAFGTPQLWGPQLSSDDLKPRVVLQALFEEEPEEETDLEIANLLSPLGTAEALEVADQLYADRATLKVRIDDADLPPQLRRARQVTSKPLPTPNSRVLRE